MWVQVPSAWQTQADVGTLKIRAKPLRDADELAPTCARCEAAVPLVNARGDVCPSCGAEIIRSFATFEALPLVEFELARLHRIQTEYVLVHLCSVGQQQAVQPSVSLSIPVLEVAFSK